MAESGQFVIQRIKSMDRMIVKPLGYETEAIDGQAIQHLHLRAIHSADSQKSSVTKDVHVYETLAYSYDEAHKTRGPLMDKPSLREISDPMVMDNDVESLKEEAERLLNEIVEDLESESFYADPSSRQVADKIDMLRRVLSLLEFTDLSTFVSKYAEADQWSTAKQILVDALVLSGTNPSIMIVRNLMLNRQLTGEQAVQAASALPATVKTPTKELLALLVDLLKSEPVAEDYQLRITLALSLTRLINQACIDKDSALELFPKLVMGQFCRPHDDFITKELLPWLTAQLANTNDTSERIAILAALGNIGHEVTTSLVLIHLKILNILSFKRSDDRPLSDALHDELRAEHCARVRVEAERGRR